MSLTTDRNDPELGHGADDKPVPQNKKYLVLSEEERAKGFINPVRDSYIHVGTRPKFETRPLTEQEKIRFSDTDYVLFEIYPESERPKTGRFWSKVELESGCNALTTMNRAIAETYARDPWHYGSTYCVHCRMHRPLREFVWEPDGTSMEPSLWRPEELKRVIARREELDAKGA